MSESKTPQSEPSAGQITQSELEAAIERSKACEPFIWERLKKRAEWEKERNSPEAVYERLEWLAFGPPPEKRLTVTKLNKATGHARTTILGWITDGVNVHGKRVYLEATRIGGRWITSTDWYTEFIRELNYADIDATASHGLKQLQAGCCETCGKPRIPDLEPTRLPEVLTRASPLYDKVTAKVDAALAAEATPPPPKSADPVATSC